MTSRTPPSASWTTGRWTWRGAGAGQPAELHRRSRLRDLGRALLPAHALPRGQGSGRGEGIADFGMRALLSMRLEKNFPTWFAELRPIYGAVEGGMERFVRLDKDASSAAMRRCARPRRGRGCAGSASRSRPRTPTSWATSRSGRGSRATGARSPPATASARRASTPRGATLPAADARRDGDWRVVGWVTSGGYGHSVALSLAQGYLPAALAERDEAGPLRGRDPRGAPAGADLLDAAVRPGRGADAGLTAGEGRVAIRRAGVQRRARGYS